jgi:sec-independent protein translocase protein TatA
MIGSTELIAIIIFALFLFGPKELPELAKSLGAAVGEFKKAQRATEMGLVDFNKDTQKAEAEEKFKTKINYGRCRRENEINEAEINEAEIKESEINEAEIKEKKQS